MKKRICCIILVFILLNVIQNVSADETIYLEKPTRMNGVFTVNDDFSISTTVTFQFINSLNQPVRVEYFFPIKEYDDGFDLYATNSSVLASTINGSILFLNGTLPPYTSGDVPISFRADKSTNNPSDGIYKLDTSIFSSMAVDSKGTLEIRLPLKKGDFEYLVEPVNCSITPSQYKSDNQLILSWNEHMDQSVKIEYTYESDIFRFITENTWIMLIIGAIIGSIIGFTITKGIEKVGSKPRKKANRRK